MQITARITFIHIVFNVYRRSRIKSAYNTDSGFFKISNLILKSDWDLISPYSIAAASNIMVMRIRKMIANLRSS